MSIFFLALISNEFSHANTNADTITPANTAMARSKITVSTVTSIITKISARGTLFKILKVFHANVPITTINITPTSAAIGIISM